jgi:sugar (pentulose or hexulose) kinase
MIDARPLRTVAVIDVGKTNAKLASVEVESRTESVIGRIPNTVRPDGPYPHFDVERTWAFILDGLAQMRSSGRPDAIVVTTHGASGALLDAEGSLAMPVLDYEHDGPQTLAPAYDALRPGFDETGSPRLPNGLNLGAQIFWQQQAFPAMFARARSFVTHPQYWAHRLCGVAANEPSSLGAHTDLWDPTRRTFSSLVARAGWSALMAPVRGASDALGPLRPDLAGRLGLPDDLPVFCGIHDSNASLYPHLLATAAPFAVVSTGTWVISLAVGGREIELDPVRDTLMNVNAFGDPVASARFMGGREFAIICGGDPPTPREDEVAAVLADGLMLTPSVDRGSGPFQGRQPQWLPAEPNDAGPRAAAASFYLAMMTATGLELCGADGPTIVEGPFGRNACFARMLASATGRPVEIADGSTGTSVGAALLCSGRSPLATRTGRRVIAPDAVLARYAVAWRAAVA